MKVRRICFAVLTLLLLISCDHSTGIDIANNTGNTIIIECKTVYDAQFYKTETYHWDGTLRGIVRLDPGYAVILASPLVLSDGKSGCLISTIGFDVLVQLGLGTMSSRDDVVFAIETIFEELNVYTVEDGIKKLLCDKSYFFDKENMGIKGTSLVIIIR